MWAARDIVTVPTLRDVRTSPGSVKMSNVVYVHSFLLDPMTT